MKTLELYSGTKSFSKVAEALGHSTFTVDNNKDLNPDRCIDFLQLPVIPFTNQGWDILWASPPCTAFSVASIGRHWTGGLRSYIPKSETAKIGLLLLDKTIEFISIVKPKIWFIENPRGVMRKVIDEMFKKHGIHDQRRLTISYCQYGDSRMKPTDIWTNSNWKPRPICKNGAPCHIPAPRGSKTGTQGIKGARDRGIIPPDVFTEIFNQLRGQADG
jgi:hypothetical protein